MDVLWYARTVGKRIQMGGCASHVLVVDMLPQAEIQGPSRPAQVRTEASMSQKGKWDAATILPPSHFEFFATV